MGIDLYYLKANLLLIFSEECEDSIGVSFVSIIPLPRYLNFHVYRNLIDYFCWQLKLLTKARYSLARFKGEQIVILSQVSCVTNPPTMFMEC